MKPLSEHVATLAVLIQQGQTLEAMECFYADDVTMQENEQVPRVGKAVCLEYERRMLADVTALNAKLTVRPLMKRPPWCSVNGNMN